MEKNILIVNFNTQKLTEACIKSVNKFTPGCKIYVFDNSDQTPFINTFDNVKVIDNTKGQIIDFEEWLDKYPDKKKSGEATKIRGSAKHCYTIEFCLSIIPDGFLLLDSDILVKRDLSNIWDEEYIYCGDVITQPNSKIKRVLPYVCYVNSKMCTENNIHYFNENYMHGLHKTTKGDGYDTGAGFYINSEKLSHKQFNHEDYIIHYKGGSWFDTYKNYELHKKNGKKEFLTVDEWLEINKKYWDDSPIDTEGLKEESFEVVEPTVKGKVVVKTPKKEPEPKPVENTIKEEPQEKKEKIENKVVIKRPKNTEYITETNQIKKSTLTGRKIALIRKH